MNLTVTIPTLNRADWLRDCLVRLDAVAAALAAAGHRLDVVVSDNASSDATAAVAAEPRPYPLTYVRRAETGGIYHSIATALLHGTVGDPHGALILIGDDDALEIPGTIAALDRLEAEPGLVGVAGAMFSINIHSGMNATGQGLTDPRFARMRLDLVPEFFNDNNYLEVLIARKSAWQSAHPYVGIGLPCHTRALVRFLAHGEIAWLPDVVMRKQFHKWNVSRQFFSDYQQIRIVIDRELAVADLALYRVIQIQRGTVALPLIRDYMNGCQLSKANPLDSIVAAQRVHAHGYMAGAEASFEAETILAAACEMLVQLVQLSARSGPLLVPADHPGIGVFAAILRAFADKYEIEVAPDGAEASGRLRLVMTRADLAARAHAPEPQVAFLDLVELLRLSRRPIAMEGIC